MASCDEGRLLLAAVNRDLTAFRGTTDPRVFADEIFGFHVHQAAEKALKAWPCILHVECPRTHDLALLLALLDAEDQDVGPFLDAVQCRCEAFDDIGRVQGLVTAVGLLVRPNP